jgi:uncharacterized protein (TIGR03083 family)
MATGTPGEEPPGPADPQSLVTWYAEGAAQLVDRLRRTDPDSPAWCFGPRPRLASFWSRRQAHETALHLADARRAVGAPVPPVTASMAADGVDEVATMFFPRQVRLGRMPALSQGVRIVLEDAPGTWVIAGDGTDPRAAIDAAVRGPADLVWRALWRRADPAVLEVSGDADAAWAVLSAGLTP